MTRDEQLEYCRVCKNQKFDFKIGLICGITDRVADFDEYCTAYEEDAVIKGRQLLYEKDKFSQMNFASHGKRFANRLIDLIACWAFMFVFAFFIGIILAIISPSAIQSFQDDSTLLEYILAILSIILYYTLSEFIAGRTLGKLITGTKVVDENGGKPSFDKALLRTVCRFIPFEAFSFLGDEAIGWHDTLSKTRVVNVK
jgi:uncharacterized RDD family membrane protein YckC